MTPQEKFAGGTAVVTGAGSGIGEGLARVAAGIGMNVVLADIDEARLEAVAASISADGGTVLAVPTDVTDIAALERLADVAYDRFGSVQLVVNNAGIETIGFSWDIPDAVWDRLLSINVRGVIHGSRIFARRMIASGMPGHIANVASIGGLGTMPTQAAYTVSKHAVLSFTECLYLEMEVAGAPIGVSAILPGPVATRIFDDAPADLGVSLVERQRAMMQSMLSDGGQTPVEAAGIIMKGIAAGDFWVLTHPEIASAMANARARYLAAMDRPALADEARALVS